MSNANSATQAPHTEEDVLIDLSDSGGMQSPQTNVNDDVEFSDSSLDQLPCAADNYTMDLCDVDVIPSTKFTNANLMELPNSDADQDHPERSNKQPSCSTETIQLLCHQMIEYSSSVQHRLISWVTCLLLQLLKHQIHHSDIFRAKRCS